MTDTFKERVRQIPGEDGWWKRGSESTFLALGVDLMKNGFSEDEAIEFLESAYWAVARCFGS